MEYKNKSDYLHYIINVRRNVHANPELSFLEYKTQQFIISELAGMGLSAISVGTGVVSRLDLGRKKTVAFRADIDALPITEQNSCAYISKNKGVMHACGHDGHIAVLLAFAKYCSLNPDKCECNIVFIFQPGEETEGGALSIIESGLISDIDEIFAIHVDPSLKAGKYGICKGPALAGDYSFDIIFKGENSHCAEPKLGRDALLGLVSAIAEINKSLKLIKFDSYKKDECLNIGHYGKTLDSSHSKKTLESAHSKKTQDSAHLTFSHNETDINKHKTDLIHDNAAVHERLVPDFIFHTGTISGGSARNVLADSCKAECTVRYFETDTLKKTLDIISQICDKVCNNLGTSYEIVLIKNFIPVVNSIISADFLADIVKVSDVERRFTAEDFAFYLQKFSGCLVWLGVNTTENPSKKLHSPVFDFDEQALLYGLELFIKIVKEHK